MKFLFPAIALTLLAGCNSNMATHRTDFRQVRRDGAWTTYYAAVAKGEKPEPPRELKDR